MANPDTLREVAHTRAPFSAWLGVVLMFLLFGVIVLAIIGSGPRGNDYEQKRAKAREEKLKNLREEDTKALGSYGWVDKSKGVARVPIDRAMQLTVAALAQKQPAPAGPIATPPPPAAPAPAAPAKPAPAVPAKPTPAATAASTPTATPQASSISGANSEARGQPAAATNPPPPSHSPAAASPTPAPAKTP